MIQRDDVGSVLDKRRVDDGSRGQVLELGVWKFRVSSVGDQTLGLGVGQRKFVKHLQPIFHSPLAKAIANKNNL
jgi:hypothetical protein